MFENYKDSLLNNKTIMQSQLRFKSDHHNVYAEEVNKIALNSLDDKRLQTFDRITTYPYGANAFKVYESQMFRVFEAKAKLKKLSNESETFLKHVKTKCESKKRKYMKLKKKKHKLQCIND